MIHAPFILLFITQSNPSNIPDTYPLPSASSTFIECNIVLFATPNVVPPITDATARTML